MDFDDVKENIQPLAAGRNASILQAALHVESQQELQQQRRQYEDSIKNYGGDDPLEPWFEYIYWIEQSFPSGGKESGLEEVLLKCLTEFEKYEQYHQDRRMIKLYIKYIDTHENPQECYQQLYNQGIGTMVADLYICWAYYYDLSGNFRKADQIFRMGIDCHAQPFEELQEAHQHFGFTMSQRILYDDDNSKHKYQCTLQEKRHALTSLKSHKKKVGSVRTGAAVKSYAPGKIQANASDNSRRANVGIRVFEDENKDPNTILPPEQTLGSSKSVVKIILDSARKQENVKEPGPWNKVHDKNKGKLFVPETHTDLGFEILEDEEEIKPIKGKINYGNPFIYIEGFVVRNRPQGEWNLPVALEVEYEARSFPAYDKCMLYPQPNMEFSPEELYGYNWCKRRNIENKFTKKYDTIWKPNIETGVRIYPNFARKNLSTAAEAKTERWFPLEESANAQSKLVFNLKLFYPCDEEELQLEEVMYRRLKSGERKLKYGANETIALLEEMEETVCLPNEAPRRKSFFPTRKSIAPPQLSRLPKEFDESEEEEQSPTTSIPRRSVIMKTPKKEENSRHTPSKIPIHHFDNKNAAFAFKTPAPPPAMQNKLAFEVYEEEENNFEGNETCSTQVFNCFIKAQSVSTPKTSGKVMKLFSNEHQPLSLNFSGTESTLPPVANINPISAPPLLLSEYNDAGLTLHSKQLSTIMETSEQVTSNTASTKSSIGSPDSEPEVHSSKVPPTSNKFPLETVPEAGSLAEKELEEVQLMESLKLNEGTPTVRQHNEICQMPSVKIFADHTETMPKILFAKAGNFSRLENREDTTPSINPVKFQEDKTETITKLLIVPKNLTQSEVPPDEEMLEKTNEKSVVKNIFTPTSAAITNRSIFTASAFMNFHDSPQAKQKCNYDYPDLETKLSSLKKDVKKSSNVSFLLNFDDPMETEVLGGKKALGSSFLPNLSPKQSHDSFLIGISNQSVTDLPQKISNEHFVTHETTCKEPSTKNILRRKHSNEESFLVEVSRESPPISALQKLQTTEDSFLLGGSKQKEGVGVQSKQKSKEDSFLSGFPSVTVGSNRPQEDSFMSYLSTAETPKAKQAVEDSFMKKFSSSGSEQKVSNILKVHKNPADTFLQFSFPDGKPKTMEHNPEEFGDSLLMNSKGTEKYIMPNLQVSSTQNEKDDSFLPMLPKSINNVQGKNARGLSFIQNKSASCAENLETEKLQRSADIVMEDLFAKSVSRIPKPPNVSSMPNSSKIGEHQRRYSKVAFLGQPKDSSGENLDSTTSKESCKSSFNKSLQQPDKTTHADQGYTSKVEMSAKTSNSSITPEIPTNQNQSISSLSFLTSFTATELKKQPARVDKFTIFEDSTCEKASPVQNSVLSVGKNVCFDASLRPDDFFEENIRTEAFAANLSMIKNSTWLPNHNPHGSQIKEESFHIKEEISSPSTLKRETIQGLSIFSSVPQEKSIELMPPPPRIAPKFPVQPSTAPTSASGNDCIEITESDNEEDFDNLGQSIYYTKTPKTPKMTRHAWNPDDDKEASELNHFIHRQVGLDITQQVIDDYCISDDVNPFNRDLLDAFLNQIDFTNYIENVPTCDMVRKIKPLRKDSTIMINDKTFHVVKLIGEGSYGAVYCAKEPQSGGMFALKQERPANLWEYYICLELRSRLRNPEVLPGFMNVEYALIGNNAGILVSKFSQYGSLITVCNKIKKETLKNVDEYVVMHMASQLLLIIDHLHASNIIHADVKPDNFILLEKLVPGRKLPTIQLIDFGNSIDMDLFKKGQTFKYCHEIESFKCVEMHEKRPWTYQLDLFGLAGVIHVLLFGKYMELVKKPAGWTHKTNIPRYFKKSLWANMFHSLLNVDDCQTMPNLQNLRAQLEEEISENDKSVCQKIVEFNRALVL